MFYENSILLVAGLILLCGIFLVGEVLAKKYGWE